MDTRGMEPQMELAENKADSAKKQENEEEEEEKEEEHGRRKKLGGIKTMPFILGKFSFPT